MGYDIWQRGSSFCIRKENFPGLVKVAIQRFPDPFDEMSSVREIFKEFDFEVDKDEEGNLSDIVFTGEKAGRMNCLKPLPPSWRPVPRFLSMGRITASGSTGLMANSARMDRLCLSGRKIQNRQRRDSRFTACPFLFRGS